MFSRSPLNRPRPLVRITILSILCILLASIFGVASAQARFEWIGLPNGVFASKGAEGEIGSGAEGIAVNYDCYLHGKLVGHELTEGECKAYDPTDGRVYVADGIHNRVTAFDSRGHGIDIPPQIAETWGWNVVKNGPDIRGSATVDAVTVRAMAGQFQTSVDHARRRRSRQRQ